MGIGEVSSQGYKQEKEEREAGIRLLRLRRNAFQRPRVTGIGGGRTQRLSTGTKRRGRGNDAFHERVAASKRRVWQGKYARGNGEADGADPRGGHLTPIT